jgi:hypothetical protein
MVNVPRVADTHKVSARDKSRALDPRPVKPPVNLLPVRRQPPHPPSLPSLPSS